MLVAKVAERRISGDSAHPPSSVPGAVLRSRLSGTRLVGREREIASLSAATTEAFAGSGRIVFLSGEPGVGKSALAMSTAREAQRQGAWISYTRGWSGDRLIPFSPWYRILAAVDADLLPPELGATYLSLQQLLADSAQVAGAGIGSGARDKQPERCGENTAPGVSARLISFFRKLARLRPVCLVFDDLQLADPASLAVIAQLSDHIPATRLLVLGAYTTAELAAVHQLRDLLTELARHPAAEWLTLGPLAPRDIARLIEHAIGKRPSGPLVAAIYRRTDGNPWLAIELINFLQSHGGSTEQAASTCPVPECVRQRVRGWLARLSSSCQRTLYSASVMGARFHPSELAVVSGLEPQVVSTAVAEAMAAGLIAAEVDGAGRYRFIHGLVRDAIHEHLPHSQRLEARNDLPKGGPATTQKHESVFRREGQYWTIVFGGQVVRLRDTAGLRYISYLIRHTGQDVHVIELVGARGNGNGTCAAPAVPPNPAQLAAEGLQFGWGNGNGVVLDTAAKAAYQRRLTSLDEDLEEARRCNDTGRIAVVQREMDFLLSHLAGALREDGRSRGTNSAAGRARVNVCNSISATIKTLREHLPALARHFANSIRTGILCRYSPGGASPWNT
ncbi:MAG: AAA family ATPase [Deltaproteobacteria bacterium]|nr:AAA family ATPase [Deltaproteobacteria bacterium]